MIDTIVLTLPEGHFRILDYDKFTPSARGLFEPPFYKLGKGGVIRCIQNSTKEDRLRGRYRPRLTLTKRVMNGRLSVSLRIECSIPKLLYGNNFTEIAHKDQLQIRTSDSSLFDNGLAETMGLFFAHSPENSVLSAVHYSKNIILPKHITASMVISELGKLNLTKRLDLNKTDYRNEGHAVRFHANSYEIVFYDKIKDLEQAHISERRAVENDSWIQSGMLKDSGLPKGLEVLRMEVRLNTRRKIKSLCEKLGLPPPQTLRDALRPDIAQTILLHFWGLIERELNVVSLSQHKPEDLFQVMTSGGMKSAKTLQVLGGLSLIQSVGIRGLRSLLGKTSNRTWQRLKKALENYPISDSPKAQVMRQIRESLIEFLPIKPCNAGGAISFAQNHTERCPSARFLWLSEGNHLR
ncbi:MAG: hypothetical protein HY696_00930 [Deltaproteobacteria bacterium]|nr:hypothetical protein [Deltaproteobacteria bacterium]